MTRASVLGETTKRAPTSRASDMSVTRTAVPQPAIIAGGAEAAKLPRAASAPGRFNGTSATQIPASPRAAAMSGASSAVIPRRIAMIGTSAKPGGKRRVIASHPHLFGGLSRSEEHKLELQSLMRISYDVL